MRRNSHANTSSLHTGKAHFAPCQIQVNAVVARPLRLPHARYLTKSFLRRLQIDELEVRVELHERVSFRAGFLNWVGASTSGEQSKPPLRGGRCEGVYWRDANEWLCPTAGADWA